MATILIVEDDALLAEALADTLAMEGYQVAVAKNGEAALASCAESLPALILLDLGMPLTDGLAFLHERRQRPGLAALPVLVITSWRNPLPLLEGLDVAHCCAKPFELDELLQLVGQYVPAPNT